MSGGPSVEQRLTLDAVADLQRLEREFTAGRVRIVPTDLAPLVADLEQGLTSALPDTVPPVLAVSVGGSNTKAALLRRHTGRLVVDHLVSCPNPSEPTQVEEYWDQLLLADPRFADYLRTATRPVISFAVAVLFHEGVPFHATKIETLEGLVARTLPRDADTHHLERRTAAWLTSRGLPPAEVRGEGDGPVSHLGALASDPEPKADGAEGTMLLVCGTGLATALEGKFVLAGMAETLGNDDPQLHPLDQTEAGQVQYRVAGKGVWGVLRRAIKLHQQACDTLRPLDVASLLPGPAASRVVYDLAAVRPDHKPIPEVEHLTPAAQSTLIDLARRVTRRAVTTLANQIIATDRHAADRPTRCRRVYLTGSIARNPMIVGRLQQELACRGVADRFPLRLLDLASQTGCPVMDVTLAGAGYAGWARLSPCFTDHLQP